ncbi:MAG: BamA/TamA family outer membrane protein, partial [Candidatus Dependentiae bacterium]|nr:BamA/TamA family outer membrane protein [Candidatus Dependentiae bacterium]
GCFADFLKLKHYDVDTLKNALDRVTQWYLKEGFWDMKVLKQDFVLREYPGHQQLVLTIDEGQRSYLTALSIECWKELETQGPFSHLQKQDLHIPFDTQLLHDQRQWLLEYFRKQGYFHVEVKPDIQRNHGNVAVTWKVKLGESKVSFGKTVVVGTSRVPFEYIKRELQYHEGQIWDKDALKKTSAKLKNLEIFEGIHIYPDQVTKQEPEKAIMVKLQEDDPFEVRLRGGFALQNFTQQFSVDSLTYMAGGAFIFKNPFNKADQFKVDVDFARGHREVVAEYRLPWLFSQPIQTVFMGYSNKYFQPGFIGSKHNVYATTQHGFLVGFNRKFRAVDVGCNIGFELMNTESVVDKCALVEGVARAINFNKQLFDQSVPSFQLEPTMMIDLLDQQISPTKGLLTLLSLKGLFPLSRSSLNTYSIKALVEQSFFMPFRSVVGALRFRVGHIFHKEFSNIMPIERFYLGGANSLRSYDTDFASPLGSFIGDNGQCQYAPQGGKSMVNLNAELRFPIFKRLGGVVFQDLGALSSDGFATFDPRKVLFGTGFGLRLATPVGPLRFDIAWKLTKPDPSTRSYAWFLTFGQAF